MIINSFDNETKPITNLKDFYGEAKKIIDVCIVTFSKKIFDAVANKFILTQISEVGAANGKKPIYMFVYEGISVGFYLSEIGSTLASQMVIEVMHITGATKFIMFGSAGSLNKKATTGRFIIPTHAYRDEGMSYHYMPPSDYIEIKNSNIMETFFKDLSLPYVKGRVWTTDAFLRETVGQMNLRKSEGCIAVEMELAGVQSVCNFHNLNLYYFLVTGDALSSEIYDASGLTDANHNINKFFVALEIVKRIK